jgi:pilus assembly protein CpaE
VLTAEDDHRMVALMDLDLSLGVADVFLDAIPDYTIVDLAQNVSGLDFALLKRSLTKHSSGLYLLPRPAQLQDAQFVTPESLQRIIGLLKATFTHLILDLSKSYQSVDLKAMELADDILLVTQLDLPGLRNVVRLIASLEQIDGLNEKIKVIVNRVGLEDGAISMKKAQGTIGREIFWQIPNSYRTMVEVRNSGVPLIEHAAKATITQSFLELARALTGDASDHAGDDSSAKNRWLAFWQKSKTGT